MNSSTSKSKIHTRTRAGYFGVLGLTMLATVVVFSFGAIFFRSTTNEAYAWYCTIQSSTVLTSAGADVTLTWNSDADTAYITIDQFPGEQLPPNGIKHVSITETTTFTAHAHDSNTNGSLSCKTTVTLLSSVNMCENVSLTIDDKSFTWDGPLPLETYTVEFCDGTKEVQNSCYYLPGITTLDFTKRIKSVEACGLGCNKIASQECPLPKAPSCTLTASPLSVERGQSTVLSWTSANATEVTFNGISSSQLTGSSNVSPATTTTYSGTFYGEEGTEPALCSVTVSVTEPPVEPTSPSCTISVSPSSVTRGATSTITWTSTHASSVVFTGITSSLLNGSIHITPATTTTYTGIFMGTGTSSATCSATLTVVEPSETSLPTCSMSIEPSQVSAGATATLHWSSANAVTGSIDHGIGSVALNGSNQVTVNEAMTYTGTFTNGEGKSTICTTDVSIKKRTNTGGGGGRCLNCDDEDDEEEDEEETVKKPSIVLGAKTTKPSTITLGQVPYTGFEATPIMTVLFWIGVLCASVVIAYAVTVIKQRFAVRAVSTQHTSTKLAEYVPAIVAYDRAVDTQTASVPIGHADSFTHGHAGHHDTHHTIEERAHADNILLSPEAVRMITDYLRTASVGEMEALDMVFTRTTHMFPREDGWVLLSKERCVRLLESLTTTASAPMESSVHTQSSEVNDAGHSKVSTTAAGSITGQMPRTQDTVVSTFVRYLATNDQAKAFEILRNVSAQGSDMGGFIARVVRDLDEVYKQRIEGNRKPDQTLLQLTQTWSPATFEAVLGSLVECIDYSYSNPRIGAKVGLAKVFDTFAHVR